VGDPKDFERNHTGSILDSEDEDTLAAIDRGIKAVDEGRFVPMENVGQRMQTWLTKPSSPKTRSPI
jgi:predicted transcriptional regulator